MQQGQRPLCGSFLATEARGLDGHLGSGDRLVELLLDMCRLYRLTPVSQALMQAMQAPDIPRMLAGPAERFVQAEIGPIDRFRLFVLTLLQQKRA